MREQRRIGEENKRPCPVCTAVTQHINSTASTTAAALRYLSTFSHIFFFFCCDLPLSLLILRLTIGSVERACRFLCCTSTSLNVFVSAGRKYFALLRYRVGIILIQRTRNVLCFRHVLFCLVMTLIANAVFFFHNKHIAVIPLLLCLRMRVNDLAWI